MVFQKCFGQGTTARSALFMHYYYLFIHSIHILSGNEGLSVICDYWSVHCEFALVQKVHAVESQC